MLNISINQIIYSRDQLLMDHDFTPFYVDNYQPEWREFRHLIDFYRAGKHLENDFVGLFSPKFNLKTKITGDDFLKFCQVVQQVDVIFINPFPQNECIYYNVWEQGETWHPGLIDIANRLLNGSGFNIDVRNIKFQTSSVLLFSNFWVGSPKFWQVYVGGFLDVIAKYIESEVDVSLMQEINQKTFHTSECGFMPFIIERLFSTFLTLNPQIISANYELKEIGKYFIHPFEEKAARIGKSILASQASDRVIRRRMIRLGRATTSLGKKYFLNNVHPHL